MVRPFLSRAWSLLARYPEVALVLAAAVLGLAVRRPLAWLAGHQGISVLLAVLVFATALTINPADLRRVPAAWRPALVALVVGITVLPALSWAVAQFVPVGPLREGVMVAGLAPCEIASVATTAMAGGEAALSAGLLIGSAFTAIVAAGPVLSLEAGDSHAAVHPGAIVTSLALVVGLPLAAGLLLRARSPLAVRAQRPASVTALVSVAALVALIAAEVRLSGRYVVVALALAAFLAGSALAGLLLGYRSPAPRAAYLLLTTSMRDFAIAAGLAAAAFGPAAAAPLGLYGILVLIWGTSAAGRLRHRQRAQGAISGRA